MPESHTSASNSIILRLRIRNEPGIFGQAVTTIGSNGGNIGAIDIVRYEEGDVIRDVTVDTSGAAQADAIAQALDEVEGISLDFFNTLVFHREGQGRGRALIKYLETHGFAHAPWEHQMLYDVFDEHDAKYSPVVIPIASTSAPTIAGSPARFARRLYPERGHGRTRHPAAVDVRGHARTGEFPRGDRAAAGRDGLDRRNGGSTDASTARG